MKRHLMKEIEEASWKELRLAEKVITSEKLRYDAFLNIPHLCMRSEEPIHLEGIKPEISVPVMNRLRLNFSEEPGLTSPQRMVFDYVRKWPLLYSTEYEKDTKIETTLVAWVLEYEFSGIK